MAQLLNYAKATVLHQLASGNISKTLKVAEVSEGVLYKIPQGTVVAITSEGTVIPVGAATDVVNLLTGVVTVGNIDSAGNLWSPYENVELGSAVTVELTGKAIVHATVVGTVAVGSRVTQTAYSATRTRPSFTVATSGYVIGVVLPKSVNGNNLEANEYPILIFDNPIQVPE
jgi:hypothetical protein